MNNSVLIMSIYKLNFELKKEKKWDLNYRIYHIVMMPLNRI
jgi:hypothetical protein